MGLAGRRPQNSVYKALKGDNFTNTSSDALKLNTPEKPSNLSKYGNEFWDRYIPRLIELGIATELDSPALEQLAYWFGVWAETKDQLQDADYSTTATGRLLTANTRAFDAFRRLALHYGLTPLSRGSLTLKEPPTDDDDFFVS